jgi:hypothetical protein
VVGKEPGDDSLFACSLLADPVVVALQVEWKTGAQSWTDVTPWPTYIAGDKVLVDGATTPTATAFRLTTGTLTATPQVGQTIAFFDASQGKLQPKRIGAVSVVVGGALVVIDQVRKHRLRAWIEQQQAERREWSEWAKVKGPNLEAQVVTLNAQIEELERRLAEGEKERAALRVELAASSVRRGGRVWVAVHDGDRSGRGGATSRGWQNNRPVSDYLDEVKRVLPSARLVTIGSVRAIVAEV